MSSIFSFTLAYHCAPALYGVKASNLINLKINDYLKIKEDIVLFNKTYQNRVRIEVLKENDKSVLLLVYYVSRLASTLFKEPNYNYLLSIGYPREESIDSYLDFLKSKLSSDKNFPHEIGIFLDYDLNDVLGFINNEKCLYTGYCKVYSDLNEKKKKFLLYTRCRRTLVNIIKKGQMLDCILN